MLPPDVVCLYSEDRKFFLHGELYCALASAIGKGGKSLPELVRELARNFPADKIEEALKRLIERRYIVPAAGCLHRRRRRLLGEPRPAAGDRRTKSRKLPRARSNRSTCRARPNSVAALERARRPRRRRVPRPDGHAGERLSRTAAGRIEPAAGVGPDALAAGATLRRLSAGGTGVQAGRRRLLDLPVRPHDPEPGGQGISRPRTGAPVAVSPLARNTLGQSAIQFAALEVAKAIATGFRTELNDHIVSHRFAGLDRREALRGDPPAMPDLRQQEAARPAPRAGADRAQRRRQAGHDQRRIPHRVVAGHGGALSQACEPAHRRGHAARADRSRFADEHQLSCNAQFLGAGPERRSAQGGIERRQLRQGQHRRAGRSQRADGGDRALFRNFSGRRDQGDAAVHGFCAGRCHSSQRRPAVQRRAINRSTDPAPQTTRAKCTLAPTRFDPSAKIEWSPVWSLRDGRFKYHSDQPVVFFLQRPCRLPGGFQRLRGRQHASRKPSSRDSSNWWSGMPTRSGGTTGSQRAEVDLSQFDDSYVRDLQTQLADAGRKLWVLDVTSDLGVPTYVAILHWMQNGQENIEFGSGAHFDKRIALAAYVDRTEPIPVDRPDGRRIRREAEPRRRHAVASAGLSVPDAKRQSGYRVRGSGSQVGTSTTRAIRCSPASISPGAPASISSSSIRRGPTSRSRWSE